MLGYRRNVLLVAQLDMLGRIVAVADVERQLLAHCEQPLFGAGFEAVSGMRGNRTRCARRLELDHTNRGITLRHTG